MSVEIDQNVINVNEYELKASPGEFSAAIERLAERTMSEGHPGVLGYRFFVNAAANTAGAVIVYEDVDAWLAHHRMAYEWEEMPALQATVSLKRLTWFGPFTEEVEAWRSNAGLTFDYYDALAAGFNRTA